MTGQQFWQMLFGFMDCTTAYFYVQLRRCALFSVAAFALVMLLRSTVLKRKVFLKGMIWSIFLVVPFLGKLRLFYENNILIRLFWWRKYVSIDYWWCRYVYLLGLVASAVFVCYRKWQIKKFVLSMSEEDVAGEKIYVSDTCVTPFTTGIFHTKITIPQVMLDTFSTEELQNILRHEKTHIRLGHLWCYLLWDILRIFLWPNPLFIICMKYFREDLEDVCDRVTIQQSGSSAYEYGRLLLKSIKVLQTERLDTVVTFMGENGYRNTKQRFLNVANYKPYNIFGVTGLCLVCMMILVGLFASVKSISYPNYTERDMWLLCDGYVYETIPVNDQDALEQAVTIDEDNVTVDMTALNELFQKEGIEKNSFFICFGGYDKLPGFGGGGSAVYIDGTQKDGSVVLPYHNNDKLWTTILYKYL